MMKAIVSGVAKALRDAFPDAERIYMSAIEQELEAPAFLVRISTVTHKPHLGGFYVQEYPVEVVYFTGKHADRDADTEDAMAKMQALPAVLRQIEAGGQTLTARNTPETVRVDGDVHCTVTYPARWRYEQPDEPVMMEMETREHVGSGGIVMNTEV